MNFETDDPTLGPMPHIGNLSMQIGLLQPVFPSQTVSVFANAVDKIAQAADRERKYTRHSAWRGSFASPGSLINCDQIAFDFKEWGQILQDHHIKVDEQGAARKAIKVRRKQAELGPGAIIPMVVFKANIGDGIALDPFFKPA